VKKTADPITIDTIKQNHALRRVEISQRLDQFRGVLESKNDLRIWEEMVFCFFTGGCSAKMGMRSVEAVRHLLINGTQGQLAAALTGVHRYPNARGKYVAESRQYLNSHCGMRLWEKLQGFECGLERRDWLARDKQIKGLGYKEASHFLRNIGYSGYAILDKHVLNCLFELKLIDSPTPPNTRSRYLTIEYTLKQFSDRMDIDLDEMDLVLWSMKTGEILK
jgi:N-glycosylase/DNA lyase